jgi:hypothetical protein
MWSGLMLVLSSIRESENIASVIIVAPTGTISKGCILQVPLDDCGLSSIRIVNIPTPTSPYQVESAIRVTDREMRGDFETGYKGRDVSWKFRGNCSDRAPIFHKVARYALRLCR